tara:strand:- start:937 stop:1236 length:300 start_codon:yes stop_codon:yes gene_type:complete
MYKSIIAIGFPLFIFGINILPGCFTKQTKTLSTDSKWQQIHSPDPNYRCWIYSGNAGVTCLPDSEKQLLDDALEAANSIMDPAPWYETPGTNNTSEEKF